MNISEKIENIIKKLKTRKSKNIIYLTLIVLTVSLFGYRFYSVTLENNIDVFNIVRNDAEHGIPVNVLKMEQIDGVLYEPLTVKNNRAYVSGNRAGLFYPGQKLDDCKIVSVSKNIDLDTGMHVIKTLSCSNGLHYAENKKNGFYVPVSAVHGDIVYVIENGIASAKKIIISARDTQNVLVKSGIQNGDIIILSNVKNNQKIKIIQ
jgi:hypothetical protein